MQSRCSRTFQNGADVNLSSDGKESLYVTRNELFSSDTGLSAESVAQRNTAVYYNSKAVKNNNWHAGGFGIAEQNFLSHADFPDVQSAVAMTNEVQAGKAVNGRKEDSNRFPTHKVAKFKPFDPFKAPANFQNNNNKNLNSQTYQNYNAGFTEQSCQFYTEQAPGMYHYIPPQEFEKAQVSRPGLATVTTLPPSGASATAVAPNGQRMYIPLDDDRYEIKRDNHDLYDLPHDCELRPLSSEGQFESSVQFLHSPRPVDTRGSLSDDWSSSSDCGRETETESEHESETTETDESEVANKYVAKVLKTITESVENLVFEQDRNSVEKDMQITDNTEILEKNDEDKSRPVVVRDEIEEKNGNESYEKESEPEISKKKKTDEQTMVSLGFEADNDVTAKRPKIDEVLKNNDKSLSRTPELINDTKFSKRSKRPRAWKENRKEKTECTNDQSKLSKKDGVIADIKEDEVKIIKDINTDHQDKASSLDQAENIKEASENNETVIVDGQYYFPTGQLESGQYTQYYVPENCTVVQNNYQQYYQSTLDPSYTMFIHDACPPPRQDEVYTQVHKSLSGELINLAAPQRHHTQVIERGKPRQQSDENIYPADSCTTTEQVKRNAEANNRHPCNGTEHVSSSYTFNTHEQSSYNNQGYYTGAQIPTEAQPEGQGQLFVCYDEESVYIDPASGLSYPALHMTNDYLVTVILREGVFLEITHDKALRLVNHDKKLVVALNESGTKACVIHPAARIYQSESSVHTELYLGRRAKMTDELVMFGNKLKTYKFDHRIVTEMEEEPVFRDLTHDESVTFLSTDCGIGNEEMKLKMNEILSHAHFWKNGIRGSTVIINGTKVVQNEKGEVSVYCGPIRFLRMNPEKMVLRLKTHIVEVDIETNWNVKVTRGSHALNASHIGFIVSNGIIKACLDSNNRFHSFSLPNHRALMIGQPVVQHRPGVPGGQHRRIPSRKEEPESDHSGYVRRHPDERENFTFREWEEGWDCNFDHRNSYCYKRWDPQAGRWVYPTRQWHRREHR